MIGFKVEIKGIAEVQAKLEELKDSLRGPAMQAAINKTVDKAQAEINRAIREEYAVKAEEVRNSMTVQTARKGQLEATIRVFGSKNKRGRSLNMIHFLAAAQAAGVAMKTRGTVGVKKADLKALGSQLGFKIKRNGGLRQIAGAFVGNKGRTVFMREGKSRLPIKAVQVIGFSQMFTSRKISSRVMAKIRADLPIEVDRAIKAQLARFNK